jgi:hypothetical protein
MIKKFNDFINESSIEDSNILLYYAFDWDDNILNMPTVIHLEKRDGDDWTPVDVSTAEFALIRDDKENYRLLNGSPEEAYSDFRDTGPAGPDIFLEDTKKAISGNKFAPSWQDFVECLSNGALFAIITARGHESETMRRGVEWIIDNVLTEDQLYSMYNHIIKFSYLFRTLEEDFPRLMKGVPSQNNLIKNYLDSCHFVGVSAPSRGGSPENPEKAKEDALMEFIHEVDSHVSKLIEVTGEDWKAMIGFSDDDVKNEKHINDLIDNLNHETFQNISKIVVKGTKNPENITKNVREFDPVEDEPLSETSHQTPGLENSVLPFTQFGNMTGRLNPSSAMNRQDDFYNQFRRQVDYLSKASKEVTKDMKKRKKSSK